MDKLKKYNLHNKGNDKKGMWMRQREYRIRTCKHIERMENELVFSKW